MRNGSIGSGALILAAMLAVSAPASLSAQQTEPANPAAANPNIVVNAPEMVAGPEIKGIISARSGDKIRVTAADGTSTVILVNDATKFKSGGGLFGGGKANKYTTESLLNGLPVTVKTVQSDSGLLASQISFKSGDMKTAAMIRNGTAQGFEEQTAATEALRGRMADIDKYNVKATTNVYFDTGKTDLSYTAKNDLCAVAAQAEATDNALLLVVGYTDSVGSDDYNQDLSERRAGKVINYLQQVCHWKPYRMLTPTGMAKADPAASNDTPEGRAQNRRVSVNILVSKGLDGM
ncbi:OmpA family protein [Novosphingobium sp.]|uniref:OmpA family protein n=1 Tax=Novosphingobium sp. TaxID=1874826 RepID=UPI0035B4B81B